MEAQQSRPIRYKLVCEQRVFCYRVACSAVVFFERAICSRKRHVETSRREEEMYFSLPSPSPLSFFRPRTYRKGYYFYSPQSSTVIKSKMAATTILRTRTRFRPPKIRLHCRLVTAIFADMLSLIIQNRFRLLVKYFSIRHSLSDVPSAPLFVDAVSIFVACAVE